MESNGVNMYIEYRSDTTWMSHTKDGGGGKEHIQEILHSLMILSESLVFMVIG